MIRIISFCFFLVFSSTVFAQSKLVQEWKDLDKIETSYYFYPSTLRMINLERDPNFDKLVKPIRKLTYMNLRQDSFERSDLRKATQRIIEEEDYENYVEMDGPENTLFVIGKESKGYTCVLAYNQEEYHLLEIQGMIDIMQLSKLYEKISTADSTSEMGILKLMDMMGSDRGKKRSDQERRREWEKEREERANVEQFKQDSLNAIETKSAVEIQQ